MSSVHIKRFVVWRDSSNEWRWRAVAANGKIVASGEGYTRKSKCLDVVYALQESSDDTEVIIDTPGS